MPVLTKDIVATVMTGGASTRIDVDAAPKFKAGDIVETINYSPKGATRLPRYARGRKGVVAIDHGVFRFTDTAAHSDDHKPQHCYAVKFTSQELWGEGGDPNLVVAIDAFEDYLKPAS